MKTREFINAYGLFMVFVVLFAFLVGNCNNKGIIALDGYKHGVAFCGKKFHSVVFTGEAHVWNDDVATYVINEGHKDDPQVNQLKALAETKCAKLKE